MEYLFRFINLDGFNNTITYFTIRNAYLAKIPYTVFAGNQASPVAVSDTYNFLDGLEQRYGVEELGTRENRVFQN